MDNFKWVILPIISAVFWISLLSILYTYLGYPLLIAFISFFSPKRKLGGSNLPSVTLLIAAYNEQLVIENKIKNCLSIDYPVEKLSILIVSDGSSDQTPEIVSKYAASGIRLLHQPERRGKMAAIDRAMAQVSSDIVVFSDANNYYQPETIKKLVAPFNDPHIGAVSGSKVIDQGDGNLGASEGLYWKYESFIKVRESRLDSCTSVSGEILAIRKNAYVSPSMNIINDDFYIAMQVIRQGYRLVYVPEARSSERVSLSAKDEIIRRARINAGRYQAISRAFEILPLTRPLLVWQIISHKFLRPLVPFAMIFMLFSNILLILIPSPSSSFLPSLVGLSYPFGLAFLVLQGLFYISAWIGTLMTEHGDQSKIARLLYLPAFLTNSNFAALRGFIQFLRGSPTHIWDRIQRR